jgi:hypothetical protein
MAKNRRRGKGGRKKGGKLKEWNGHKGEESIIELPREGKTEVGGGLKQKHRKEEAATFLAICHHGRGINSSTGQFHCFFFCGIRQSWKELREGKSLRKERGITLGKTRV